ncbi:site-specific DNA-methyltransferase [Mycoplasma sp. 1578d]|uniref:DNA methyltransferase n=1 Tax=Mycoplasma sp. 1578d TaxID=2967299 RepID=UPI00211B7D07|nr:site-specific DNA-methyltransferase [Mycoplasma sp. 1578d]UUM19540.1 site-specific DNA-methyltransferase [Mycoplasma sp. 1578d]
MANISQQKRRKMINFLDKLKQINEDEESIKIINEIENYLNDKKYGLIWEKHTEKLEEMLEDNVPVFMDITDKKISYPENEDYNFLLEGDNLHSLTLLEKTHKDRIDVIYIDPPYNTGNKDFIYNDSFVEKSDGYYHSKWLSFMSRRIQIAKKLLKDDGIIFISIDDNEQAQLKLLCDEIFGEQNLVSTLCVELSKTQGMKVKSAQEGRIVKNHEYIYVYCKDINKAYDSRKPLFDSADIWDNHYSKVLIKNERSFNLLTINDYIKEHHKDIYKEFENRNLLDKNQINEKSIRIAIMIDEKIKEFFYKTIADKIVREMACSISIPREIKEKLINNKIVEYKKYFLTYTSNGKLRQYRTLSENINKSDEYNSVWGRVTIRGALWKGFYSDMMNIQKEGMVDFKNGKNLLD